jgi:hypothetical protein
MKRWICYNMLGENPETIDTFSMISGMMIVGFLCGCWAFFFVFLPLYALVEMFGQD